METKDQMSQGSVAVVRRNELAWDLLTAVGYNVAAILIVAPCTVAFEQNRHEGVHFGWNIILLSPLMMGLLYVVSGLVFLGIGGGFLSVWAIRAVQGTSLKRWPKATINAALRFLLLFVVFFGPILAASGFWSLMRPLQ